MVPVFVVFNDDFVEMLNGQVALDQSSDRAVGRFDKFDRSEVNELFLNKISSLSVSSIASVSMTDSASVSNVLNEISATIADLACQGKSLRLNFKVGSLIIANGKICW